MTISVLPCSSENTVSQQVAGSEVRTAKVFDYSAGIGTITFSVLSGGTILVHQFGSFTDQKARDKIIRLLRLKF